MALKPCKECGTEYSTKAKTCPKCGAPAPKKTSIFTWLVAIFIAIPFLYGVFTASQSPPQDKTATADSAAATEPPEPTPIWSQTTRQDSMSGEVVSFATTTSLNGAHFDFPYTVPGGSKLSITARDKSGYLDVFFTIEKGQMMCSHMDCSFDLKVGDGPIQKWTGVPPSSAGSDIMFVRDAKAFESILKTGEPLKIRIEFYQSGWHTFDFVTAEYPGAE